MTIYALEEPRGCRECERTTIKCFESELPLDVVQKIAKVVGADVVCAINHDQWTKHTMPQRLWQYLRPEQLFVHARYSENSKIVIKRGHFVWHFHRGELLDVIPVEELEGLVAHWCHMQEGDVDLSEATFCVEQQLLFLPHIEAYVAERKAAAP
ncbi:MAG: hypothetical protein NTZ28_13075 [Nitrospirae bacterium]|nr:hypothetical protein [Nitrospirota bacterium]